MYKREEEPALMVLVDDGNRPTHQQFYNQKDNEPRFGGNHPRMQMFMVKTQHIGQVDTVKEPTAKIAHEEKVHAQAEQVKNNNKHHEYVINQKQFE